MTNKQYLIGEAENLFVYKLKTVETIANELNLSRKTVMNWKEKGDWDNKRKLYIKSKIAFHEELFEFARKLMKDISADIDAGEKVDQGRMYTFCKLIPMFTKVKDYEDIVAKKEEKATPRGLTPELIAQIEEEVLGITHNDNNNEEIEEN